MAPAEHPGGRSDTIRMWGYCRPASDPMLRSDKNRERPATPAPDSERLDRMRQAVHDPLFLADLKDTMGAFAPVDSEWWESDR